MGIIWLAVLANIVGGMTVLARKNWAGKSLYAMISVGGGLLFALTVLDLLPHTAGHGQGMMPFVLIGFLLLLVLDLILRSGDEKKAAAGRTVGVVAGFMVHAFLEGVSLVAGMQMDTRLGLPLLTAMMLHRIPDGVTVASFILAATGKRSTAFLGAVALGLATYVGAISMQVAGGYLSHRAGDIGMALATGVFLYISATHIVPLVQDKRYPGLGLYFIGAILCYLLIAQGIGGHHH
ncbi:ZIP family metal transporter [Brevibacillus dissolubilis]|uniref:ZIP family metal transporter n=1 Tax=Brevibacillus dissolubilis TaxID=1844116 RepID=UPI0021001108|nr:ZIP family metal transporter [Brevibacillus dissolubilis]